jgi:hypothetical protein
MIMIQSWAEITLIILAVIVGGCLAVLASIGATIFLLKALVYSLLSKEQRRIVRQKVKDHPFPERRTKLIRGGRQGLKSPQLRFLLKFP